jgi:hypothetical protein
MQNKKLFCRWVAAMRHKLDYYYCYKAVDPTGHFTLSFKIANDLNGNLDLKQSKLSACER